MKGACVAALVASLALSCACTFGERRPDAGAGAQIPSTRVSRAEFRVTVEEVGLLKARISGRCVPGTTSTVERLVPEGTHVEAGDPVIWLDTEEDERELEQFQAQLRSSTSDHDKQVESIDLQRKSTRFEVALSAANLEFAKKKLASASTAAKDAERQAELGLVSGTIRDERVRELEQAELDLKQADFAHQRKVEEVGQRERRLDLELTRAAQNLSYVQRMVDELKRDVADAIVRAPIAGNVYYPSIRLGGRGGGGATDERRKVRAGDRIGPWREAPAELPDKSSIEVMSQVDEGVMSRITPGVPVVVTVTALEGLKLDARVKTLGSLAMPRSKSEGAGFVGTDPNAIEQVVVPTVVTLEEKDERLQPGMTVAVSYVLDVLPDVVAIPEDAVFGDDQHPVVFIKTANGHEERSVTLGPTSGGRVAIRAGLSGGEELLLGDPRGSGDAARATTASLGPVPAGWQP